MPVYVSMLRAVNVGGHNKIKMEALRALYASLKFEDVQTYVQSGNVVFRTKETDETKIKRNLQKAIEKAFGFAPEIILRNAAQLRSVVAANPFANRKEIEPGKLHVSFLASKPGPEVVARLETLKPDPEEMHLVGAELFIYFPEGAGRSKLGPMIDRATKIPATARNWNSVLKLLEMAEKFEE